MCSLDPRSAVQISRHRDRFHNPAIGDPAALAIPCRISQCVSERRQAGNAVFHARKVPASERACFLTILIGVGRQSDQGSDFVSREPQITGVTDKSELANLRITIGAAPAWRARSLRHQAYIFVETDRVDLGPGPFRYVADHQHPAVLAILRLLLQ